MGYDASFRVWRGDDTGGALEEFTVEVNEGEVVLDIVHRLQATQAPDLAVRWNCKAGKCGSCSAEVNGKPGLMCMTRMSTFDPTETITVTPMRTFPVIRDLVTDVAFNYQKAREVPSFAPPSDLAPGEYRMQQVDVERSQEFRKCIECFLCNNTCHVVRDHDDNKPAFAGPRYLMRIAELEMHPLDTADRRREAQDVHGLGYCNITKCCTEVCPEHIQITDNALIPLKERVADTKYDPVLFLGSRIPTRASRSADRRLDRGDVAAAEAAALAALHGKPTDRGALETLAEARAAQNDYAGAAAYTATLVAATPGRGRRRASALEEHARALLLAAESGQISATDADAQLTATLREAQSLAASGTVLSSLHARHALVAGRLDDAEAFLAEGAAWSRSDPERADDLLTTALLRSRRGLYDESRAAVAAAAAGYPDNPRLPLIRERLGQPLPTA